MKKRMCVGMAVKRAIAAGAAVKKAAAALSAVLMVLLPAAVLLTAATACADDGGAAGAGAISIAESTTYMQEWDGEAEKYLCEFCYQTAYVGQDMQADYPALETALEEMNSRLQADAEAAYEEELASAREMAAESPDYFNTHTREEGLFVQRADGSAVSFLGERFGYSGGAHGWTEYAGWNFDPQTGRTLALTDVVTDVDGVLEKLREALESGYPEMDWSDERDALKAAAAENLVWTIGYGGISFYFGSYELGSYAEGNQTATVPFAGNENLFNEKYLAVPAEYGIRIRKWEPAHIDVDGDGAPESVSIWGESGEWYYDKLSVTVGRTTTSIETFCYDFDAMLLCSGGKVLLYVEEREDNDYKQLEMFDLTSGTAVYLGTEPAGRHLEHDDDWNWSAVSQITNPADFVLDTRTYMLSTVSGYKHYGVGTDGLPLALGSGDWFDFTAELELTAKQSFEAEIVDENGTALGRDVCPAGASLRIFRSDNETYTDAYLADGRIVRIFVDGEGWPRTVNGVDIDELFEGMMFAG